MYRVALTPDDEKEVIHLMWNCRSRWRFIGIELGIDVNKLDAIEKKHRKVEDCLTELITTWLRRNNPKPTRNAITKVLEFVVEVMESVVASEGINVL
jgi:hypothetical protein